MNIYLINEDGDSFYIKAKTMHEAVKICEESYLEDRMEEEKGLLIDGERLYYHEQILQSCSLIGELKN